MSSNPDFDGWYAARQLKVVLPPRKRLETFGTTLIDYRLISELPDNPNKIRVREGRLEAAPPQIIRPNFSEFTLEGFGEEAGKFLDYLREHEKNLRILSYGCHLKRDVFSEQVITDNLNAVVDRVCQDVREKNDLFSTVLVGEDEPWEVSILELWRREVVRSAHGNIADLQEKGRLFGQE